MAVRAVGEALENSEQVADPVTMATGLKVAGHVAQKLKGTADLLNVSVSSLATTLQFVFVDTQSGRYSYSVVGDGHCIVREPSGNSRILGPTRRTADYGAPHILLEDWQTYFYNEVGELDAESLILTFTDGLDPLFITPKSEAMPIKVATPQSVDAFNAMFSKGYNENQAIFAASQTIEKDEYSDRIRDDVSFIALKWHSKAKSSTNNADRQKPSKENTPKEAKSDGAGKGAGLASSKRPSSTNPSQVDEESEREWKTTSHESATLGSDTTSPNPLANDEDNSFKRARNSPFRMLLRIFVGAVSASAIIATVLFLAALYMGWITLDVAF